MLRLRKRHCFRFGFVGYGCGFAQRARAGAQCACFGRDRNGPYVFHVGRRERCRWRKTDIFVHAIPTRKPAGANPHVVAGLLTRPACNAFPAVVGQWQRVLRGSPFRSGDSQQRVLFRIPYCPVRPADGNHDDAKIVFFRFVGAFRVQKNAKKAPDPPDAGSGT